MSKCKIALLAGVLLSLLVFTGCPSPVDPDADKAKVTFKFGSYAVEATSGESTFTQKFPKSTKISWPDLIIKSDYKGQVAIDYWEVEGTDKSFDFKNTVVESDITLVAKYAAVNVLNLAAKQINANTILVTWDYVNNSNYVITYKEKNGESITPTNIENGNFSISGISLNEEYTITAKRTSTLEDVNNSKIDSITTTVKVTEYYSHTEWLMLMYMDGDNNLNDPIYLDLNEAEYGLSKLPAGSSVRIIALWDGWNFETNNEDGLTSFLDYFPVQFSTKTDSTKLLELGADSNLLYEPQGGIYYNACMLSPSTIDLTSTANWIQNNEVDMSKEETLENFLKWVNESGYTADKIILQFSNHGGGPRSAVDANQYGRRSMCWDETSGGKTFLKTSDVSKALEAADLKDKNSNTISLIMEDVCLGGSLEEAYELKDYAKYYVGSPNNVPGSGFDYISFVNSLTNGTTIEEVGCNLVKTYRSNYEWTSEDWSTFIAKNPKYASYDTLYKSICNTELSTLSFIDLSKINSVKNAVNELAQLIYNDTETEQRLITDKKTIYELKSDGFYYDNNGNKPATDADLYYVYRKFGIKWWTAYYGDPIYYTGSFGCLKDLGAMCAFMRDYYPNWTELNTKANAVTSALSQAIVASWRDGYNAPTYYKIKGESYYDALGSSTDLGAGLTINCSCWVDHQGSDGKTYRYQEFADWYKTDLAFGKDCTNWTNLIESWWGTSN